MPISQTLVLAAELALASAKKASEYKEDTYGRCIECGQPIAEKRLEALPWASRCVKDEDRLERENLSRRELFSSQEDRRMLS